MKILGMSPVEVTIIVVTLITIIISAWWVYTGRNKRVDSPRILDDGSGRIFVQPNDKSKWVDLIIEGNRPDSRPIKIYFHLTKEELWSLIVDFTVGNSFYFENDTSDDRRVRTIMFYAHPRSLRISAFYNDRENIRAAIGLSNEDLAWLVAALKSYKR